MEIPIALSLCTGSIIFFNCCRLIVGSLAPASIKAQSTTTNQTTQWKWTNTMDSLLHSFFTGIGSLLCFYADPETARDVVNYSSPLAHSITAFSVGYFIFDFFDMLLHHRKRSSYELMLHHAFVVSCFGVSMLKMRYLGFVMVALVIEVNSVFLHWRQLLILCRVPKCSTYYRTVSLLNLFTFLLFRIVTLGWMTRWLALNRHKVPLWVHSLGCVATATIIFMSIVLFLRILKADFHHSHKTTKTQQ